MSSQRTTFISPEEYLEHERRADYKSEYCAGEMFALAGASRRHRLIFTNLVRDLSSNYGTSAAKCTAAI